MGKESYSRFGLEQSNYGGECEIKCVEYVDSAPNGEISCTSVGFETAKEADSTLQTQPSQRHADAVSGGIVAKSKRFVFKSIIGSLVRTNSLNPHQASSRKIALRRAQVFGENEVYNEIRIFKRKRRSSRKGLGFRNTN